VAITQADLDRITVAAFEESFNQRLLARTLLPRNYADQATGRLQIRIVRPDSSGVTASVVSSLNPDPATHQELTSSGKVLTMTDTILASSNLGMHDLALYPQGTGGVEAALSAAVADQIAQELDARLFKAFQTGVPSATPDNLLNAVGTTNNFLEIDPSEDDFGGLTGSGTNDGRLLYDELRRTQTLLRTRHHDEANVGRPWAIMHPVAWAAISQVALSDGVDTELRSRVEAGADVVDSRAVGSLHGFDVYLSTQAGSSDTNTGLIRDISGTEHTPILIGFTGRGLEWGINVSQLNVYPSGSVSGTFDARVEGATTFGSVADVPALMYELPVRIEA